MPAPWLPGRPPNSLDVERTMNGAPVLLGVLVSTGTAVDNSSATSIGPTGTVGGFNFVPRGPAASSSPNSPTNLADTLAGRVLLLLPTAAGSILRAQAVIGTAGQPTVTGLIVPTATTQPGVKLQAEERLPFIMGSLDGWLQFIPTSGSANLFVWELT